MATITDLLGHWRQGDSEALPNLVAQLYDQLHHLACIQLARERADHTLQPTALLNELYLELMGGVDIDWANRNHFFAVAASIMRRVLVDHARKRARSMNSGKRLSLTVLEQILPHARHIDLLDLDRALDRLKQIDEDQHRIAEMRLFAGLTTAQIAQCTRVTERTVQRKWACARIWLHAQVRGEL